MKNFSKALLVMVNLFVFSLLFTTVSFAATENTSYLLPSFDSGTNTVSYSNETKEATVLTSSNTTIGNMNRETWYVVKGSITFNDRVIIVGDVNLILADGAVFTANKGISVNDDDYNPLNGSPNNLAIYAQSNSEGTMGRLIASYDTGSSDDRFTGAPAGLGGDANKINGEITINGGDIRAESTGTGSSYSAAIGGGYIHEDKNSNYNSGPINIYGGKIDATAVRGAAIGGSAVLYVDSLHVKTADINIYAGDITAKSNDGSGIGAGEKTGTVNINIYGGKISSESVDGGGIGRGSTNLADYSGSYAKSDINYELMKINIFGGEVTASSKYGAGLGGGQEAGGGVITITGGNLTATSQEGSGIGSGNDGSGAGEITITGATTSVTASSTNGPGIGGTNKNAPGGANSIAQVDISSGTVNSTSAAGVGIGGDFVEVDISGGYVTASGYAAGIGKNVVISDGVVDATSINGAGIGSGSSGNTANVIITGGKVTAKSQNGAGIGTGYNPVVNDENGQISISGGEINASSINGAGIGSGKDSNNGNANALNINISGGTVAATSNAGYSIGSGDGGKVNGVTISGGAVSAKSIGGTGASFSTTDTGSALIIADSIEGNSVGWSGIIYLGVKDGEVYRGPIELDASANYIFPADRTLNIRDGETVNIPLIVTNEGTIIIQNGGTLEVPTGGFIQNNGTVLNFGTISDEDKLRIDARATEVGGQTNYLDVLDADGSVVNAQTPASAMSALVIVNDGTTSFDGAISKWYFVGSDVTISERIVVTGDVHLILGDGATLNALKGIQVADDDQNPATPSANSLTIYSQSSDKDTMGKLIVTMPTSSFYAGIGGGTEVSNETVNAGSITIDGGNITINAEGTSSYGAAIGGGAASNAKGGHGGSITIRGGYIAINENGNQYSSIGGGGSLNGDGGDGGNITISGGEISMALSIGGGNSNTGVYGAAATFSTESYGYAVLHIGPGALTWINDTDHSIMVFRGRVGDGNTANGEGKGYIYTGGDNIFDLKSNLYIPADKTLYIASGQTLSQTGGIISIADTGRILNSGSIQNVDSIINNQRVFHEVIYYNNSSKTASQSEFAAHNAQTNLIDNTFLPPAIGSSSRFSMWEVQTAGSPQIAEGQGYIFTAPTEVIGIWGAVRQISIANGVAKDYAGNTVTEVTVGQTVYISSAITDTTLEFNGWSDTNTASPVSFGNAALESTSFVMPDRDVSLAVSTLDKENSIIITGGTADASTARAGEIISVSADAVPAGKKFTGWSSNDPTLAFDDRTAMDTFFTMPVGDVSITANYADVSGEITGTVPGIISPQTGL